MMRLNGQTAPAAGVNLLIFQLDILSIPGQGHGSGQIFFKHLFPKESSMADKVHGSVLVVGGGIAGMQAALDLADSGYFVHVVEKSPAIGGVMSELDKTFPTNDCAM
jgi:ribulose 1,5-bisphosphate synthetase/thiazole synthase